jgi:hypothetical protein
LDITFRDSYKQFFSNLVENGRQVPSYPFSLCCGFEVGEPPIALIDVARKQTALLKTIDKPRDHAFISSKTDRELSGRDTPGFDAANKYTCFLHCHPKSQEAAIERCLEPNARLKQPGHEKILPPVLTSRRFGQASTRDWDKNTRDLLGPFYFGMLGHFSTPARFRFCSPSMARFTFPR